MKVTYPLMCAALLALVIPAATADVCYGCGGSGTTQTTALNRLAISNGHTAGQAISEPQGPSDVRTCRVTIRRLNPRRGVTKVNWHTKDGTATSSPQSPTGIPDYAGQSGTATFSPEQPGNAGISININQDFINAPSQGEQQTEDFFVVLTNPRNGVVIDRAGRCVIQDFPVQGEP